MFEPGETGSGAAVTATDTSAAAENATVAAAAAMLFVKSGSEVDDPTDMLFVMTVPSGTVSFTWTTKVKAAVIPDARDVVLHAIEPVAPSSGVVHDHSAGEAMPRNVV